MLGRICESIGEDIPMFTPQVLMEELGICCPACVEGFLAEHATSHDMGAVFAGRETLNAPPFVMAYDRNDGTGLRLLSPKPGHEDAFLGRHRATGDTPIM